MHKIVSRLESVRVPRDGFLCMEAGNRVDSKSEGIKAVAEITESRNDITVIIRPTHEKNEDLLVQLTCVHQDLGRQRP
jgi:hypothetical protein